MAALSADYHTTFAAELVKKTNEANPFDREQRLIHYRESTFPVLVYYIGFYVDNNQMINRSEKTNVVICTALENFDDFVKDMRKIFGGPEGEHYVLVKWNNGTETNDRDIAVDNQNFHTILRMLEARPCVDEVIVRRHP
ncbi:hypothetical protein G7Y79_00010g028450 [Physcia stellaris]|nr:hypothetical protein G7Y79_00010g028450 [Physcia stellaris]